MLYNIICSEEKFIACIQAIESAYYSEKIYKSPTFSYKLSSWYVGDMSSHKMLDLITERCQKKQGYSYTIMNEGTPSEKAKMPFPFIDRFHQYFLERKWNAPKIPVGQQLTLHQEENTKKNYSRHSGDYKHFMNVVSAVARLIMFFQNSENIVECVFKTMPQFEQREPEIQEFCNAVAYGGKPTPRTFQLMLAAFYHDLGKTIVSHRHGMEGSIIISDHTSRSWYQLNRISQQYPGFDEKGFRQDDLLFVSDLVLYHDIFGTLTTGETGYLRLVDVLDRIKRFSLKHSEEEKIGKKLEEQWNQRYLFDLWLLNVADIMTSIRSKWERQTNWNDPSEAQKMIKDKFFSEPHKSSALRHDLWVARNLLGEYHGKNHTDKTSALEEKAIDYSERHGVERVRRFIYATLTDVIHKQISERSEITQQQKNSILQTVFDVRMETNNLDENDRFNKYIIERICSKSVMNSAILKAIRAVADLRDFCANFSLIGQMDYALGFFEKIASRALELVHKDLNNPNATLTNWISSRDSLSIGMGQDAKTFYEQIQASSFVNNYTMLVVQMLSRLIFREKPLYRMRNIEFHEATNRLTIEKIDTILSLNGPYKSKRTTQLILQTVFLY